MRYQEPIYIQNDNGAVRNKDILNVNMSSDICVFESPQFSISGASKIDCTGATSGTSYVLSSDTQTIPLTFTFTANTSTFVDKNAQFRFEIFKYNEIFSGFSSTPVYNSDVLDYSGFSATNITTQYVPVSGLSLDGEYIIKPFYRFGLYTDFLSKLDKTIDTNIYISGNKYNIYDDEFDYYFAAIKEAETPSLTQNTSNLTGMNKLRQQVVLPTDKQTTFSVDTNISGDFVVTLNGLVLAPNEDYYFTGNTVFLSGETYSDDIITVIYTTGGGYALTSDNITISSPIVSGVTGGQGNNVVYYNTTTGKYEVYTSVTPQDGGSIILMLNGATLANNIDYYQSTSDRKRLILEGDLLIDDMLTIVYYPNTSTINGLETNNPMVTWKIQTPPQKINGLFTLEVALDNAFTSMYYTGTTDYQVGVSYYAQSFIASGTVGTTLYYRVKNEKNYTTICGDVITSTAYSEVIPVIIQSNSINSY